MEVRLLNWFGGNRNNEKLADIAAALCVDKYQTAVASTNNKHLDAAIESGHYSVLEHLPLTWLVEDISRACSHQLVRHRIASYSQQSQRYSKINTETKDWYVIPDSIRDTLWEFAYNQNMTRIAGIYEDMIKDGIPKEDARMVLPNACFTSIVISMNARSFLEASTLRRCKRAQWEIREMFDKMRECIKTIYPTVYKLAVPNCEKNGCIEKKPCKKD